MDFCTPKIKSGVETDQAFFFFVGREGMVAEMLSLISGVMANVGTSVPLGNLLVELMSHREDNVPQHVSEAHLACHLTNL